MSVKSGSGKMEVPLPDEIPKKLQAEVRRLAEIGALQLKNHPEIVKQHPELKNAPILFALFKFGSTGEAPGVEQRRKEDRLTRADKQYILTMRNFESVPEWVWKSPSTCFLDPAMGNTDHSTASAYKQFIWVWDNPKLRGK
jgi:hypothetical protein